VATDGVRFDGVPQHALTSSIVSLRAVEVREDSPPPAQRTVRGGAPFQNLRARHITAFGVNTPRLDVRAGRIGAELLRLFPFSQGSIAPIAIGGAQGLIGHDGPVRGRLDGPPECHRSPAAAGLEGDLPAEVSTALPRPPAGPANRGSRSASITTGAERASSHRRSSEIAVARAIAGAFASETTASSRGSASAETARPAAIASP
jgi:hypothetical protein